MLKTVQRGDRSGGDPRKNSCSWKRKIRIGGFQVGEGVLADSEVDLSILTILPTVIHRSYHDSIQ